MKLVTTSTYSDKKKKTPTEWLVPTEGYCPLVVCCYTILQLFNYNNKKWNTYKRCQVVASLQFGSISVTIWQFWYAENITNTAQQWTWRLSIFGCCLGLTQSRLINSSLFLSLYLCFSCNLLSFCHTHPCCHHSNLSCVFPSSSFPLVLYHDVYPLTSQGYKSLERATSFKSCLKRELASR